MLKKINLFLFALIVSSGLYAQIPGDKVQSVYTDEFGCQWIGTDNGLLRKCGEVWKAYAVQGDSAGIVNDIQPQQTTEGPVLWVATRNGIVKISYNATEILNSKRHTSETTLFLSDVINSISIDKTGSVIFATPIGVGIYNSGNWKFMPEIMDIFDNNFSYVAIKSDTVLLGTVGEGVGRLVNTVDGYTGASSFMAPWQQLPGDNITSIFIDSKGNRWYGSDLGVSKHTKFESKEGWVDTYTKKLTDPYVTSIAEDKSENIWVGTHNGLAGFHKGTSDCKILSVENGLPSNYITYVYGDEDGSLWIGTDKGLCHIAGSEKLIYKTSDYTKDFKILK